MCCGPCAVTRMSRLGSAYLLPNLDSFFGWADTAPFLLRLSTPATRRLSILERGYEMHGAYRNVPKRSGVLYHAHAILAAEVLHPGAQRHTWVTVGRDATNYGNRGYAHSPMAAPECDPTQLVSWWSFKCTDLRPTVFRMQAKCDFDAQLRTLAGLQMPHADGMARGPLFLLRADGKDHVLLASGDGFTKKNPGGHVVPLLWPEP